MFIASFDNFPDVILDFGKTEEGLRRRMVQVHKMNPDCIHIREV